VAVSGSVAAAILTFHALYGRKSSWQGVKQPTMGTSTSPFPRS